LYITHVDDGIEYRSYSEWYLYQKNPGGEVTVLKAVNKTSLVIIVSVYEQKKVMWQICSKQ
jgi:hypothetical protein